MIVRSRPRATVLAVLLFVLLVQAVVLFGMHLLSLALGQGGFYPIVLGGDDGRFHYAVAKYMVGSGEIGANFDLLDVSIWPTVMATVMKVTGSDDILLLKQMLLLGRTLNVGAALIALEALRKGNLAPDTPRMALWSRVAALLLVGLYPSGLFYSFGSLYRDALIYGLHITSVAFLLHAVADRRLSAKIGFAFLSLPFLYALYQFRPYAAYAVVLAVGLWLMAQAVRYSAGIYSTEGHRRTRATWLVMAVAIAGAGAGLWYTGPVQQLIAFRDSYFLLEGSSLRISFTGKNPIQAFPLYAYSFVSNVIGPLPFQIRAVSNVLNFVLEVPLLTYVGVGIWRRRASLTPTCAFLIAQAVVWFAMISFSNDNLGTASRLRVIGWQLLFVVFAYLLPRAKPFAFRKTLVAKEAPPAWR